METLKSYLDTMFAVLPDTDEVRQAKVELFQMMEDRYSDLISEGKSENEAVGAVITEFDSIDEIAKAVGLDLPKKEDASDADKKEDSAKTIGAEKEEGRTNEADSRYDFGSGWASFGNGILSVRDFARAIADWSRKKAAAVRPAGPEETVSLEPFTSLDCELDTAGICIRIGDAYSLTLPEEMKADLTYEVTGDTLTIREMPRTAIIIQDLKNEKLVVTIPAEAAGKLLDFRLDIAADDIVLENISASSVKAETAAGDIIMNNCSFALADLEASAGDIRISGGTWGRVTCDFSAGDLQTDGADFQTLESDASAGNILLHALPDVENSALKAAAELGRVMLFGRKYGAYYQADGSNGKKLDLSAAVGNIVID